MIKWELNFATYWNPDKGDTIKLQRNGEVVAEFNSERAALEVLRALRNTEGRARIDFLSGWRFGIVSALAGQEITWSNKTK